jgi:putative Mg2+ transporter-C (MgtC) family protein
MNWISDVFALISAQPWELAVRLVVAMLLGGLIGIEREVSHHSAGLRTNILVSLGACLFTVLSLTGFGEVGTNPDSARVAAQVVSGIGFLGAGAVFRDKNRVRGLTTAAAIWLVAAIGMAAGAGSYFSALITTLLTLVVLVILRPVSDRLPPGSAKQKKEEEEEEEEEEEG